MSDNRQLFHEKRGVNLFGLKGSKTLRKEGFYTFDTETKDGLKGTQLFCWGICWQGQCGTELGKLQVLQGYEDLTPLFDKLSGWKDKTHYKTVYVHNLGFDVRFLVDYCVRNGYEKKELLSGSHVICFTIEELGVRFVDSLQFLLSSQANAEIDYDIPEIYRKIDCMEIFEKEFRKWTQKDKTTVFEHNANDIKALHCIMKNYRKIMFHIARIDVLSVVSLASLALKAFRVCMGKDIAIPNPFLYLQYDKELKRKCYKHEIEEEAFVRATYFGGRCEVFDMNLYRNAKYIDRVSMYPTVMKNRKYPKGWGEWTRDYTELIGIIDGTIPYEGFIEVIAKPPETEKYPILPERMDKKVCFTNCIRKGIHTVPELRYAYKRGYEITPIRGFIFRESDDYFSKFVDKFFAIKSKEKGGKKKGAKIILNSVYGKFGQAFERKSPVFNYFLTEEEAFDYARDKENVHIAGDNKLYITTESKMTVIRKAYMNVCIASYVTAYARIDLTDKLNELDIMGIDIAYCDTDSFTIENIDVNKIVLGNELGDWNIEQSFEEVKFLAPKCYIALKKEEGFDIYGDYQCWNKPFLKMKGIDRDVIDDIVSPICGTDARIIRQKTLAEIEELIREPIQLCERYMTYNESHRFGVLLASKERSKHYSFENRKRKFINGISEPWLDSDLPEKFLKGRIPI